MVRKEGERMEGRRERRKHGQAQTSVIPPHLHTHAHTFYISHTS